MKYNGIISRKIDTIEERLIKLRSLLPLKTKQLSNDYFLKSGVERTLQVCVDAMIDIANRINSIKGLSPVTTSFNSLQRLEDLKIIKKADKYEPLVKFRNLVVHCDESIDTEELVNICNNYLSDFEDFIKEIEKINIK